MRRCLAFSRKWVGNHFYMAKWTLIYIFGSSYASYIQTSIASGPGKCHECPEDLVSSGRCEIPSTRLIWRGRWSERASLSTKDDICLDSTGQVMFQLHVSKSAKFFLHKVMSQQELHLPCPAGSVTYSRPPTLIALGPKKSRGLCLGCCTQH